MAWHDNGCTVYFIVGEGVVEKVQLHLSEHSTRFATPSSLLIREGFSWEKILMEFDIFLPVMRIVEAADDTDSAESDGIFRTGLFGSAII